MSTLAQRILDELKAAMKARDTAATTVLRALKSAVQYAAIEEGGAGAELNDAQILQVIRRQIKQREDSLASFRQAGREDLAATEAAEIILLQRFLPAAPSAEQVAQAVRETIDALGASSKADMGRVMKALQERFAGAVDNRALSQEVAQQLS